MIEAKICSKCKRLKSLDKFHNSKVNKGGYTTRCKNCSSVDNKKWYQENREIKLAKNKKWINENKEKWKHIKKMQRRKEYRTVKGNVATRMSRAIRDSLKVKTVGGKTRRKWEDIVGYSVDELKGHLEKQFTDKMTWKLFLGGGIHIDHIKPISSFDYESVEDSEFKDCWSLDNLQPLFAIDNLRKGAQ